MKKIKPEILLKHLIEVNFLQYSYSFAHLININFDSPHH